MKKSLLIFLLLTNISYAEIQYDFKNADHKEDKNCIALFSLIRDGLADTGDKDNLIKFTNLQDKLILKYAYSKQLNNHADVYKSIWVNKAKNGQDLDLEMIKCISKAEGK